MSRCWAVTLRCGKFVVELLWARPLVVLYNMSVADVRVVIEFGPYGHSVLPIFFSPLNLPGRLADRHQTLPRVRWWPRFVKFSQKFGWASPPPNLAARKRQNFDVISDNFATWSHISGTQQVIFNRKTVLLLQTTDTPAQANLIRYTLVHKRRKIGPAFWPTQRAAIGLGIATYLVTLSCVWKTTRFRGRPA